MEPGETRAALRTVIGGRHGSPSLTIALPFSQITRTDTDLRDAVSDLAALVGQLAAASSSADEAQLALIRTAAEELATRVSARG